MTTLALAGAAHAATLFELPLNPFFGGNTRNKVSSDAWPSENHYTLTKVTVDAPGGWAIDRVTVYNQHNYPMTDQGFIDAFGPTVLQGAYLQIIPEGDLASFVPGMVGDYYTGAEATITELSAGSLARAGANQTVVDPAADIVLGPGTYWIGVTPEIDNFSAVYGVQFGKTATDAAGAIARYAEAGSLTGGTAASVTGVWEETSGSGLSILVEGTAVPEPGSAALLGIAALGLALRRRRS